MKLPTRDECAPFDDGTFIYAPSFRLWEHLVIRGEIAPDDLLEGKAIGTAREMDLVFIDRDQSLRALARPDEQSYARRKGITVGKRRIVQVQERAYRGIMSHIRQYQRGRLGENAFRKALTAIVKIAWRDVFMAGVRASGIEGEGAGAGRELVELTNPNDEKWLRSAMSQEMGFLNGMLDAIVEDDYKMPLPRRVRMYVDTFTSVYESARVIGLPIHSLFRWTGHRDKRTCPGCVYMMEHNPFWKGSLPTVPRSGITSCITHCRDRLLVRAVDQQTLQKVRAESLSREVHVRNLRKLRRLGHL